MMYCNPDVCPYCQYIGEGDRWCEETGEIVLAEWAPTEHFMGRGCPYLKKKTKKRKAWRVCSNPHSHDYFSDEPEYIAVPYTILGESKRGKSYLVERNGWHGKKHPHYLPKREFFFSKEEAEAAARKKSMEGSE